jgi:hypothetical protein
VLEYHQTLGEIYGFLALNGKAAWGDSSRPTTAVFQLERAYRVSKTLDDRKPPGSTLGESASPLHLDPNLTDLLATAYAATGNAPRGNEVRLEAAKRFIDAGETRAKERVLEGVRQETLSDEQRLRYVDYKAAAPQPPVSRPGAKASVADTKRWRSDVEYVAKSVRPEKPADQPSVPAETPPPSRHPGAGVVVPRGDSRVRRATEMASREGAVVEVPASAGWVDTGIDLPAGSALEISASGQWSNAGPPAKGPGGFEGYVYPGTVVRNAPLASLVGKVGEAMFAVGGNFRGRSPAAGRLYLSINDTPGTLADNQGSMRVTITVK